MYIYSYNAHHIQLLRVSTSSNMPCLKATLLSLPGVLLGFPMARERPVRATTGSFLKHNPKLHVLLNTS